jgi:hypothetical protein
MEVAEYDNDNGYQSTVMQLKSEEFTGHFLLCED